MIEDKLLIVDSSAQNKYIMDICRKLWKNNFDDSDEYIQYYFDDRWKESITFLYDDKSMLHLNPYNMRLFGENKKIYYIVGVCTNEKDRHKGYMDLLLRNVFKKLYAKKAPFVYLMPASEKIYEPYGFRGMYNILSCSVLKNDKVVSNALDKCLIKEYNDLTDSIKKKLSEYASSKLYGSFECFVERESEYFWHKNREMQACGGSVIVLMKENNIKGYAMYICEDEPEIVEIVVDEDCTDIFVEKLFEYIGHKSAKNKFNKKIIFDESYFIKEQNSSFAFFISDENAKKLLMARIIDIKAFVEMVRLKDCVLEYHVEITDDFISGNNGRWDIVFKEKSLIKEGKYDGKIYQKMTIAEFGNIIFSKIKFYLNEMV